MKKYEELFLKLIYFGKEDVITGSMVDENNDGVYEGGVKEPENWG